MQVNKSELISKSRQKVFFYCISIFFLILLIILSSSTVDPFVAYIPYNKTTNKFYGETHYWCQIIYNMVPVITIMFVLTFSCIILFSSKFRCFSHFKRSALIILLSLCLGPGIVINVILKDHWGRARPYQVLRDGKKFSPVWKANLEAHKDNSFPSGHAAIGFFVGIPFLVAKRKKTAFLISATCGVIIGTVRILQGGHYLTDVILSGLIVWFATELIIYVTENILQSKKVLN